MKIRDVEFGPVWCASGARGFFGEGYWFHRLVPGLDWKGSTFVAKTTTLNAREGNMPLKGDWTPQGLFPSCVVVKPLQGCALNAVGLSGPGVEDLLGECRWQPRRESFFLSFMSVSKTREERFEEAREFWSVLGYHLQDFSTQVGIQVNLSCPNTGHDPSELAEEAAEFLSIFRPPFSRIPIVAKVNALFPVELVSALPCDAICISNTIPWGEFPDQIDWRGLFGSEDSPLEDLGGGGLSGAPLLPLVADWIKRARKAGYRNHINACGGILHPRDVDVMVDAGANSISLGTMAMLRGWRLRGTIQRATKLLNASWNHGNSRFLDGR